MKRTRRRRGSCCSRCTPTWTKSLKGWNRLKAARGECRVTLLWLPGAGWPAFVTSSMKRTDSSTGCIDASRTRDPGEWPGRGLNFRAECAVRVSNPGPADSWSEGMYGSACAAEDVLAERFARGDIDEDEYRRRMTALRELRLSR